MIRSPAKYLCFAVSLVASSVALADDVDAADAEDSVSEPDERPEAAGETTSSDVASAGPDHRCYFAPAPPPPYVSPFIDSNQPVPLPWEVSTFGDAPAKVTARQDVGAVRSRGEQPATEAASSDGSPAQTGGPPVLPADGPIPRHSTFELAIEMEGRVPTQAASGDSGLVLTPHVALRAFTSPRLGWTIRAGLFTDQHWEAQGGLRFEWARFSPLGALFLDGLGGVRFANDQAEAKGAESGLGFYFPIMNSSNEPSIIVELSGVARVEQGLVEDLSVPSPTWGGRLGLRWW